MVEIMQIIKSGGKSPGLKVLGAAADEVVDGADNLLGML